MNITITHIPTGCPVVTPEDSSQFTLGKTIASVSVSDDEKTDPGSSSPWWDAMISRAREKVANRRKSEHWQDDRGHCKCGIDRRDCTYHKD